jgi:hypothetical protein
MGWGKAKGKIMKRLNRQLATISMGLLMAGIAQAGDMGSAVAYSLGEFDRVGASQPMPKAQVGGASGEQKQSRLNAAQSAQERQLAARKAEFVRRMFWLALSAR